MPLSSLTPMVLVQNSSEMRVPMLKNFDSQLVSEEKAFIYPNYGAIVCAELSELPFSSSQVEKGARSRYLSADYGQLSRTTSAAQPDRSHTLGSVISLDHHREFLNAGLHWR